MQSKPPANFIVSFLIGAAAGAVAALLFTPSGRENRGQDPEPTDDQSRALASPHEPYGEIPKNWKTYFSSIRERFIMAVQAGLEEMRRTREEWMAKADPNG
ncbi:MAG: hypothetical protein V2A74_04675 [bacterium]